MKKILKSKKGEGYIDICVGVVCFCMILVVAINLFSFVTTRIELDQIADNLLESATESGAFSTDYNSMVSTMKKDYYSFTSTPGADKYFNTSLKRVQLGEKMWVSVSYTTYVKGLGVIKIPVTITVKKTGLSEKYWK